MPRLLLQKTLPVRYDATIRHTYGAVSVAVGVLAQLLKAESHTRVIEIQDLKSKAAYSLRIKMNITESAEKRPRTYVAEL